LISTLEEQESKKLLEAQPLIFREAISTASKNAVDKSIQELVNIISQTPDQV
jgi:hypothetical protein